MVRTFITEDISTIEGMAKSMLEATSPCRIFALYGEMGAGKTTLVKAFCKLLGVVENTSSPTFAIINEYVGKEKIFHFDLFRLQNSEELRSIAPEIYLDSDHYIFIEWPELLEPMLKDFTVAHIYITTINEYSRKIELIY